MEKEIPYKIYLEESEMPKAWYNVRADMKKKPAPLLNPQTHKPCTAEELEKVFCKELVAQELNETAYTDVGSCGSAYDGEQTAGLDTLAETGADLID